MKTKLINIYGAPCSGKSTISAGVFYELKKLGINCELVTEFVKEWAWAGTKPNKMDQPFISSNQCRREYVLYNKVDFIITDSPTMLGCFYEKMVFNSNMS